VTVRRALLLPAVLGPLLGACAAAPPRPPPAPSATRRIAILPVDNASGGSAPIRSVSAAVEGALRARGLEIVSGEAVDRFLAAHRLRFTGAIPADAAAAAAEELGVDALLVTSLEGWASAGAPRIALGMRLVSAEARPRVLWTHGVALAGDDAPGAFGAGVVRSMPTLQAKATGALADSLRDWIATGAPPPRCAREGRFAPRSGYRSDLLDGAPRTVAVLPFVNETSRRRAGDVLTEAFVRGLGGAGFEVMEPGLVRQILLSRRIVMEGGVSLDAARAVLDSLDADLILAGYVRELAEDAAGVAPPRVDFTALMIDRRTEEIVWEVTSYHQGDEGVWAFDVGRVRSANALACRMVASAAEVAAHGPSTPSDAASGVRRMPSGFARARESRPEEVR
jgi:TolB-like protein